MTTTTNQPIVLDPDDLPTPLSQGVAVTTTTMQPTMLDVPDDLPTPLSQGIAEVPRLELPADSLARSIGDDDDDDTLNVMMQLGASRRPDVSAAATIPAIEDISAAATIPATEVEVQCFLDDLMLDLEDQR